MTIGEGENPDGLREAIEALRDPIMNSRWNEAIDHVLALPELHSANAERDIREAFYRLTVQQRDDAWRESDRLRAALAGRTQGEPEDINGELLAALEDLFAMVQGEVPSLLEDHHSWVTITDVIAKARAAPAPAAPAKRTCLAPIGFGELCGMAVSHRGPHREHQFAKTATPAGCRWTTDGCRACGEGLGGGPCPFTEALRQRREAAELAPATPAGPEEL